MIRASVFGAVLSLTKEAHRNNMPLIYMTPISAKRLPLKEKKIKEGVVSARILEWQLLAHRQIVSFHQSD